MGFFARFFNRDASQKERRLLKRYALPDELWAEVCAALPFLAPWQASDLARLRELATLFLCEKTILSARGFCVTPEIRVIIALQACVPILARGLALYARFNRVIVYPAAFISPEEWEDEWGIVHQDFEPVSGEAIQGGPVILSWQDIQDDAAPKKENEPPTNVVIHEFVHQIDMLTGDADGCPPLPPSISSATWQHELSAAFLAFRNAGTPRSRQPTHPYPRIDPYAAENPAEFFAVLSELFFIDSAELQRAFPKLFDLFVAFYGFTPCAKK